MKIAIVIPAHNEEQYIQLTLESLVQQSHGPAKIIVVDDNSTDRTREIALFYSKKLPLQVVSTTSKAINIPGSKVIQAFNLGLSHINIEDYDIICKFDADLIFPKNYLEVLVSRFRESETIGMVAGHCTIAKNGKWEIENQNNPDHIRGALKAYRKECFKQIGGLKASIGWDTIDEMLARFYGWQVITVPDLHVKHLKPTGAAYNSKSKYLQGEAFFKMRYGWWLTFITAAKMAWNKKQIQLLYDYLRGYQIAKSKNLAPLVTEEQGHYIRNYRWNGIKSKLGVKPRS
ncbi:glycosyl transferase family 2 [Nonlabens dokdonensis]|uniref:Glycosyl transferase, family 2 n=2 Tax=Nonlabens dokdonensis TaxID=328515 RepID=L7W965_NONDD|nr:glycosyltransferase family A protein [Nonlabens dokdonensis]AGC75398.1 glycosyl transferase, family 2 [Nonlabens dokdonensis DSW-6]PZX43097.1 glycosyl transferase family 2 [Nonlabens dokdonensis]